MDVHPRKVLISVQWDCVGMVPFGLLPVKVRITADIYCLLVFKQGKESQFILATKELCSILILYCLIWLRLYLKRLKTSTMKIVSHPPVPSNSHLEFTEPSWWIDFLNAQWKLSCQYNFAPNQNYFTKAVLWILWIISGRLLINRF